MSVSNHVRALINGNSPKECPPLEYHLLMNDVQNYICGLYELKDCIHFNTENIDGKSLEFVSELEQVIKEEMSNFSNLLLDIRNTIQVPEKVKL